MASNHSIPSNFFTRRPGAGIHGSISGMSFGMAALKNAVEDKPHALAPAREAPEDIARVRAAKAG